MAKKKSLEELNRDDLAAGDPTEQAPVPLQNMEILSSGADEVETMLMSNDLQGGTMRIHRKGPDDAGMAYCCKMAIKEFDLETIKIMYGGGEYRCQTFKENGQMGKVFRFSIDARFKGKIDPKDNAQDKDSIGDALKIVSMIKPPPAPVDTGPKLDIVQLMKHQQESNNNMMMVMMQMMQQSTQVMVAAMQTGANRPVPAAPDHTPILLEMIRSGGKSSGGGSSMKEMVETMASMKMLMEGGNPGAEKEEEEESFPVKMMKALAPLLMPALTGMAPARTPAQPRLAPGQPPAKVAPQATPPTAQPQVDAATQAVGVFMAQLISAAEKDADPGLYHDIIIESIDEQQGQHLLSVIQEQDWLEKIYGADPNMLARAKIQGKWFSDLRQMLMESLSPQNGAGTDDPATPTGGKSGSEEDPAGSQQASG